MSITSMTTILRFARPCVLAVALVAAACGRTELPALPESTGLPADAVAAELMDYVRTFTGDDAVDCGGHHMAVDQVMPEPVAAD